MQTPEALDKKLQRELGWRKKELLVVEQQIRHAEAETLNTAIRSGIVLLYAHWEGFVKKAANAYLEFVSTNIYRYNLCYQELNQGLIALTLEYRLLKKWRAVEGKNWEISARITDFFLECLSEPAQFPDLNNMAMLNTWKLEWENFYEIMVMLGLDFTPYSSRETRVLLDMRLFQNRNLVAHGERHFLNGLDKSQYLKVHAEIMVLMQALYEQLCEAADQKAYQDTSLSVIPRYVYLHREKEGQRT